MVDAQEIGGFARWSDLLNEEGTDGGKTSVFQGGADFSDGNFFGVEPARLTPPVEQDFDPINEAKNHAIQVGNDNLQVPIA